MSSAIDTIYDGSVNIRWKPFVEEYIEYVSEDTYRISFQGDSCMFRQFEASRMHYYGTAVWNRNEDRMTVEMFNNNINRIVEKILRSKLNVLRK